MQNMFWWLQFKYFFRRFQKSKNIARIMSHSVTIWRNVNVVSFFVPNNGTYLWSQIQIYNKASIVQPTKNLDTQPVKPNSIESLLKSEMQNVRLSDMQKPDKNCSNGKHSPQKLLCIWKKYDRKKSAHIWKCSLPLFFCFAKKVFKQIFKV